MVATVRHVVALACLGALLTPGWVSAQTEAERERAKAGVVMIRSELPSGSAFGAGIVVAATAQDVYITTANHLVRRGGTATKVEVQFHQRPGEWFPARLLDLQDSTLDLAAVIVRPPQAITPGMFTGVGMVPSATVVRGLDVYALGYPNARPWDLPVQPDKLATASSVRLEFETRFVQPGNSGGALIDSCGRVVGMVVEVAATVADAVRIESVLDTVRRWRLPTPLLTPTTSACGPSTVGTIAAVPPAALVPPAPVDTRGAGDAVADVRRLHEQERWAESLPILNKLVSGSPAAADVFALRSHAYSHLERAAEALADGEQAVKFGPKNAEAYLRRGEARMVGQKYPDAIADFDRSLQLNPQEVEAMFNRAMSLAALRQDQKALDALNQAVRLRADRYEGWALRAGLQSKMGNNVAALDDANKAISIRPRDPQLYFLRANVYTARKEAEPALADLNQALRLDPDDPQVLTSRGAVYMFLGRREAAREDLSYALRLNPGLTDAANLLKQLDAGAPSAPGAPKQPQLGGTAAGGGALSYARLMDDVTNAVRNQRTAEANALVDEMIRLDGSRPEGWALRGSLMLNAFDNLPGAYQSFQNALDRGGMIFVRVGHDHGTEQVPCFGTLGVGPTGLAYSGEAGGHQFQWPISTVTEAATNAVYGVLLSMFHIRVQPPGQRATAYNFVAVRPGDTQLLNRKPDVDMTLALINRVRQGAR